MRRNKKSILIVVLVFIFVCLVVGIYFYSTREKSVLFCHKTTQANEYIDYYMSYEVFKGRNQVNLKTINKMTIKEAMRTEFLKKGINLNDVIAYSDDFLNSQLKSKLKDYGASVKFKVGSFSNSVNAQVTYTINSKTQKQFENLFKINFYKASIDEMKVFFESGDMVCEK